MLPEIMAISLFFFVIDHHRKIKKGPSLSRAMKLKKLKAAERAISNNEKLEELMSKKRGKLARMQLAKSLYD